MSDNETGGDGDRADLGVVAALDSVPCLDVDVRALLDVECPEGLSAGAIAIVQPAKR